MIAAWLAVALAQQPVPPIRSVGFEGRPGGACPDPVAARLGECVDVVDFLPFDEAWQGAPEARTRAALRAAGPLYASAIEGLAYRWSAGDVEQTVRSDGYLSLPETRALWEQAAAERSSWALPTRASWLGHGDWLDPVATPRDERVAAFFPNVRYDGPTGQVEPPPGVVLGGRFARRLGYGGRSHDFDLMDANPRSSGPFFEQVFPYVRVASDDVYTEDDRQPLLEFRFPETEWDPDDPEASARFYDAAFADVLVEGSLDEARAVAHQRFEAFTRVVYVQTSQFALEGFTTNQMRVLAATTAMAMPPGALAGGYGLSRDLVAAARGETDRVEEVLAHLDPGHTTVRPRGVHLRYEVLPREVVAPWVARLVRELEVDEAWYDSLNAELRQGFRNLLADVPGGIPTLASLDDDSRRAWLKTAILPGEDRDEVDLEVLRTALFQLLYPDPSLGELTARVAPIRDRVESWMLSDHVRLAIAATFDEAAISTPKQVVDGASGQWTAVLGAHGYGPQPIPQGLGAVDPVAVCTTLDGLDALDEPSFSSIDVDVLVAGRPGLEGDEQLLVEAADDMPFTFVDDPVQRPEIERLVDLGDGRTLYRVRWRLWSGWHLLWDRVPVEGDRSRLVLRTGAICGSTVLAPPDLVPTVVRAGLLNGSFRPSTPESGAEARAARRELEAAPPPPPDGDAIAGKIGEAAAAAPDAAAKALEARAALEAPPPVDSLSATKPPSFGGKGFEIVEDPLTPQATYLRDLVHRPIEDLRGEGGMLLWVVDAAAPDRVRRLGDRVPRTPYDRAQTRVRRADAGGPVERDERHVRTAGWLWYFQPTRAQPVQLAPAYTPKDSVAAVEKRPRWTRRRTADFWLDLGGGVLPYLGVTWGCADPGEPAFGVSGDCAGVIRSDGIGFELQPLSTFWFHDRPRLGLDAGLDVRLETRPGGNSLLWGSGDEANVADPAGSPRLVWAMRPQVGLLLGVRQAPRPAPLHRGSGDGAVWGAPRTDGKSHLGRLQAGLRTGLLVGPGFEGIEGSTHLEGWLGWSARSDRSAKAGFTPYYPGVVMGPFTRVAYGFPIGEAPEPRYLTLDHSWTVLVGFRTQLRLNKPAPPPEGVQ